MVSQGKMLAEGRTGFRAPLGCAALDHQESKIRAHRVQKNEHRPFHGVVGRGERKFKDFEGVVAEFAKTEVLELIKPSLSRP